jgi:hypothetical protein
MVEDPVSREYNDAEREAAAARVGGESSVGGKECAACTASFFRISRFCVHKVLVSCHKVLALQSLIASSHRPLTLAVPIWLNFGAEDRPSHREVCSVVSLRQGGLPIFSLSTMSTARGGGGPPEDRRDTHVGR